MGDKNDSQLARFFSKQFSRQAKSPGEKEKKGVKTTEAGNTTPSKSNDVSAFLDKVASMPPSTRSAEGGRLIFALDATASREQTWDQATQLQAQMFSVTRELGGLQVQLCYFRGFGDFYSSQWCVESAGLLEVMTGIRCQAGTTQIARLLRHVLAENKTSNVNCCVYVGDSMEEDVDVLCQLAGQAGLLNIPLFIFQERNDPVARHAFVEMARLSRGAHCHFDSASVDQLKDLLRAAAVYASGGLRALENLSRQSPPAARLLSQLK